MPSAPAQIKAVLSAPNKILVSWLPPKFSNGPLTGYTFYMSVVEDGMEEGTHKRMLSPSTEIHEVTRGHETSTLQFWVAASTRVSLVFLIAKSTVFINLDWRRGSYQRDLDNAFQKRPSSNSLLWERGGECVEARRLVALQKSGDSPT